MPRYMEIADDLRARILDETYPRGSQLPSIAHLQELYAVPGLGTIRQAQQVLVDEGLIRTQQGVGAFVLTTSGSPKQPSVLLSLIRAREELDRAIELVRLGGR